jgi:hypothetical protein
MFSQPPCIPPSSPSGCWLATHSIVAEPWPPAPARAPSVHHSRQHLGPCDQPHHRVAHVLYQGLLAVMWTRLARITFSVSLFKWITLGIRIGTRPMAELRPWRYIAPMTTFAHPLINPEPNKGEHQEPWSLRCQPTTVTEHRREVLSPHRYPSFGR